MRVVLFQRGSLGPLYMTDVVLAKEGCVASGYVVNGAWYYKRDGDRCSSNDYYGKETHAWGADPDERVVLVPDKIADRHSGYEGVIAWAENQ